MKCGVSTFSSKSHGSARFPEVSLLFHSRVASFASPARNDSRCNPQSKSRHTTSRKAFMCPITPFPFLYIVMYSHGRWTGTQPKPCARQTTGRNESVILCLENRRLVIIHMCRSLTGYTNQGEWGPFFDAHFHPNTHECYGKTKSPISEIQIGISRVKSNGSVSHLPRPVHVGVGPRRRRVSSGRCRGRGQSWRRDSCSRGCIPSLAQCGKLSVHRSISEGTVPCPRLRDKIGSRVSKLIC